MAGPEGDWLLQSRLRRLIGDILTDPDLAPGLRSSLFRQLVKNPEHPELALLAHLQESQDPAELPSFTPCPELGIQAR
jgi:hypothetical protein